MVLGTTAHSCTFHSEGYRWLEPTTDPHAQRLSEICAGRGTGAFGTDSGASCSGENVDDGYFHMDLSQFGVEFPFMGRSEHEVFISGNGCKLRPFRIRSPVSQQSWLPADISFSGDQTGDSGQSSNPETTTIPSDDAKPDDAIFVYWTDLDFSNGGEIYISAPRRFAGSDSVTITWCD